LHFFAHHVASVLMLVSVLVLT